MGKTQLGGSASYGRTIGCSHSFGCILTVAGLGWARQSMKLLPCSPSLHVPSLGFLTALWPQRNWTSYIKLAFKISRTKLKGRSCKSLLKGQPQKLHSIAGTPSQNSKKGEIDSTSQWESGREFAAIIIHPMFS